MDALTLPVITAFEDCKEPMAQDKRATIMSGCDRTRALRYISLALMAELPPETFGSWWLALPTLCSTDATDSTVG